MNKFVGTVALIRKPQADPPAWLLRWDAKLQQYRFIEAERLEGESFRECVDREVGWMLNLRRGKDYLLASAPRLHLELPLTVPGEREETFFVVEFYNVDLFGKESKRLVEADPNNCWFTAAELRRILWEQDDRLAQRHRLLLSRADLLSESGD